MMYAHLEGWADTAQVGACSGDLQLNLDLRVPMPVVFCGFPNRDSVHLFLERLLLSDSKLSK